MGNRFRALAKTVRHEDELPRFRGLYELDALHDAYMSNERLCRELDKQLDVFKRLYCSIMSGFGRFRQIKVVPGETLIDLLYRTHDDARKWRPPGNQGKVTMRQKQQQHQSQASACAAQADSEEHCSPASPRRSWDMRTRAHARRGETVASYI